MGRNRNPNTFANNPLDRASERRADPAWVQEKLEDPTSLIVPFWRLKPLILPGKIRESLDAIGWLRSGARKEVAPEDALSVFLGMQDGVAHFALDVSHLDDPLNEGPFSGLGAFDDLRNVVSKLPPEEAAILAQGKSLIDWHRRHGFCSNCGASTEIRDAGYLRYCGVCEHEHFPRTDPVVITLVVDGDKCLLGRGPEWPEYFYSAIAGFLEPGETIEEAVVREVMEETSIQVGAVRYHSSQPWPYPSSLMIGTIALAESTDIKVDETELSDARWVSREEVIKILKGEGDGCLLLPPPMAIAHQLIRHWIHEGSEG